MTLLGSTHRAYSSATGIPCFVYAHPSSQKDALPSCARYAWSTTAFTSIAIRPVHSMTGYSIEKTATQP